MVLRDQLYHLDNELLNLLDYILLNEQPRKIYHLNGFGRPSSFFGHRCSFKIVRQLPKRNLHPVRWGVGRGGEKVKQQNQIVEPLRVNEECCKLVLTFESVDEILMLPFKWNLFSQQYFSHGAIYLVCSSNVWVRERNLLMWLLKWNLFGSTFTWYYSFFSILKNEIWIFLSKFVFGCCTLGVKGLSDAFSPVRGRFSLCSFIILRLIHSSLY